MSGLPLSHSPYSVSSMVSGHPLNLIPPLTRSCVCLITVFRVIASLPVPDQIFGSVRRVDDLLYRFDIVH